MKSTVRQARLKERGMKEIKLVFPEEVVNRLDQLIEQSDDGLNRQQFLAPIINAVSRGELQRTFGWKSPVTGNLYG